MYPLHHSWFPSLYTFYKFNLHLPTPFCMNGYFIRVKNELVSYTPSYFTSLTYKTPPPLSNLSLRYTYFMHLYLLLACQLASCLTLTRLTLFLYYYPILILPSYSYPTIILKGLILIGNLVLLIPYTPPPNTSYFHSYPLSWFNFTLSTLLY